jgi:hypothetical protein
MTVSTPSAPSLWCGCPASATVVDSNGVAVCGRCTGALSVKAGNAAPPPPKGAR